MKMLASLAPLIFLILFAKEIHIAARYAEIAGLGLPEAMELWGREHSINENFTGAELGLILRIDRAIYTLIVFGLMSFIAIVGFRSHAQVT